MNLNPIVFALRRPITIMVAVAGIALGCGLAVKEMDVDVFPPLNLPVLYVAPALRRHGPGADGRARHRVPAGDSMWRTSFSQTIG